MGLGDVVAAASAAQGSLKKLIRLKLVQERVVPPLTSESYLRVSALANICAREEVLAARLGSTRVDKVDADLAMIFAHGTGLHYVLQNEVLAETGALVGVWRCVECAKQFGALEGEINVSQSLVRRPKKCECGCEDFLYREQSFVDKEYRLGGHPDGFLILQGFPGLGVIECKSISSRRVWEVKSTPDLGHVIQIQSYLWLTGLKWGKILYWEKGGNGMQALVEHTVERDEATISGIKSMIKEIWAGISDPSRTLPERICANNGCPRAKKCPMVDACFDASAPEPNF